MAGHSKLCYSFIKINLGDITMPSQIREDLSDIVLKNAEFCSYTIQSATSRIDSELVVVFHKASGQYVPTSSDLAVFDEQSLAARVANLESQGHDASVSREALRRLRISTTAQKAASLYYAHTKRALDRLIELES
jgi:hypothetical protein